ncbi:DegT/DnrJ/EryC1/StrS family aminotransferase [Actinokineospora cianjurensis]|uniref:dTDP-4-amino-4,6-dideoxygalactose transaminase n=1 Tax=Actinokineospora cianjurensis TaxID=585224 RepID=A0A421B330_9PSEU|nr:aminotransferase class I/II-fold pyridoxal phosphate-dependent enzyme [Actinokineospora cianjurensis]RLK58777.1 dTDP-4-amino-4,6-dideoxygalactose transaminase [Actinokineospora cianjurensis]
MRVLAFRGGTPVLAPDSRPHFSWPPITTTTITAVGTQLLNAVSIPDRSGVITELEAGLQDYFGVRHAVLTSSGTAALHSMYVATEIGPGDEVIVPAYTFPATVTPLLQLGALPVLADCGEDGGLSVEDVEARITPKTRAIVAAHLWGLPDDLVALRKLADDHGLMLLEDGAHAHGSARDGHLVGTAGRASGFSMNGPKTLSAGEGGFLLTDDDEVYYRALLHGHYNKRCRSEIPPDHPLARFAVTGMGLKLRVHPLAASLALDQLALLDDYLDGRAKIAQMLCEALGELPGVQVPQLPDGARASWYGLPLFYSPSELDDVPIDVFYQALHAEGLVEVDRPGSTRPLNQLPLFQDARALFPHDPLLAQLAYRPGDFPVAEQLHERTMKLPVWHREEDLPMVRAYIDGFIKVVTHHRELKGI